MSLWAFPSAQGVHSFLCNLRMDLQSKTVFYVISPLLIRQLTFSVLICVLLLQPRQSQTCGTKQFLTASFYHLLKQIPIILSQFAAVITCMHQHHGRGTGSLPVATPLKKTLLAGQWEHMPLTQHLGSRGFFLQQLAVNNPQLGAGAQKPLPTTCWTFYYCDRSSAK